MHTYLVDGYTVYTDWHPVILNASEATIQASNWRRAFYLAAKVAKQKAGRHRLNRMIIRLTKLKLQ